MLEDSAQDQGRSFFNPTAFKTVLEFSSWILSLFSLAWSLTAYNAAMKMGALSLDVNPVALSWACYMS